MDMLTTLLVSGVLALGAYFADPNKLVVNSIPTPAPVSESNLSEVHATEQVARLEPHAPSIQAVVQRYASQPIPDWKSHAKISSPRMLMARLMEGVDIEAVNASLQAAKPNKNPGSTWWLHPEGDYDFTEVTLSELLYLFGDRPDRLYPETVAHILDKLLLEEGGTPSLKVPRTLGLIYDTENHILMRESSRYLKNQWLRTHGSDKRRHDNTRNGLEHWLLERLNHIRLYGFNEFNSVPYERYALQAVFNLEAFSASREVRGMARDILDKLMWRYAYGALPATPGGLDFRKSTSFRRQLRHASNPDLTMGYLNEAMGIWLATDTQAAPETYDDLIASILPYRPPRAAVDFARSKPLEYYVQIGHGPRSSPEILSGGPGYVLSAGGAYRGESREVVPRPTVLLLQDGAMNLAQCFHIPGKGSWRTWNNTGVSRRFACGNAPVQTPAGYTAMAASGGWQVYALPEPTPGLLAVYQSDGFGLMALFSKSEWDAAGLLASLQASNPDGARLRGEYRWPKGPMLRYDIEAPAGTWVMQSEGDRALSREYDTWPLLTGPLPVAGV